MPLVNACKMWSKNLASTTVELCNKSYVSTNSMHPKQGWFSACILLYLQIDCNSPATNENNWRVQFYWVLFQDLEVSYLKVMLEKETTAYPVSYWSSF